MYILATAVSTVSFSPQADGSVKVRTHICDHANRIYHLTVVTMTRDAAATEYRRLRNVGYYEW